eukprot:1520207-Pleurochrysis_carterae.AAC.1
MEIKMIQGKEAAAIEVREALARSQSTRRWSKQELGLCGSVYRCRRIHIHAEAPASECLRKRVSTCMSEHCTLPPSPVHSPARTNTLSRPPGSRSRSRSRSRTRSRLALALALSAPHSFPATFSNSFTLSIPLPPLLHPASLYPARACVRACVRECVRACVRACLCARERARARARARNARGECASSVRLEQRQEETIKGGLHAAHAAHIVKRPTVTQS